MKARRLFAMEPAGTGEDAREGAPEGAPLGGTRTEAMQRLQIGVFGICAMILLVGLASIIGSQADLVEESAVPDAAPTTEPTAVPTQRDPLADAGVVPPTEPDPQPAAEPEPHSQAGPAPLNGPAALNPPASAGPRAGQGQPGGPD
ncbi:hypothetical protein Ga0102493_11206 [Erythrobacter litoralis]|jgi:hypothetical protein|uniref:Uncharacterized protein n=1 Tax=Erythrobacter litoralis TaxID=39960 RepID=A0A074MNI1_9SPHN|nr:hypothetical protein [Erythrobacter litoralis]AOL24349.1 hypothetical protein Ga0102493_11206 [Erythrobacter litoralis]KEO93408.1 hypothetical protein EH32_11875 [Erythrobacter litoralis]MEE4339581.1 hypothetical protein [Erythrobacter sp.]